LIANRGKDDDETFGKMTASQGYVVDKDDPPDEREKRRYDYRNG